MNAYPQSSFEIRERLWSPFQFRNMLDLSIPYLPLPYLLRWQRPPSSWGVQGQGLQRVVQTRQWCLHLCLCRSGRGLYSAAGPWPRGNRWRGDGHWRITAWLPDHISSEQKGTGTMTLSSWGPDGHLGPPSRGAGAP